MPDGKLIEEFAGRADSARYGLKDGEKSRERQTHPVVDMEFLAAGRVGGFPFT